MLAWGELGSHSSSVNVTEKAVSEFQKQKNKLYLLCEQIFIKLMNVYSMNKLQKFFILF